MESIWQLIVPHSTCKCQQSNTQRPGAVQALKPRGLIGEPRGAGPWSHLHAQCSSEMSVLGTGKREIWRFPWKVGLDVALNDELGGSGG